MRVPACPPLHRRGWMAPRVTVGHLWARVRFSSRSARGSDAEVPDRAEQPQPDDLVGVGHRDQRGDRLGAQHDFTDEVPVRGVHDVKGCPIEANLDGDRPCRCGCRCLSEIVL